MNLKHFGGVVAAVSLAGALNLASPAWAQTPPPTRTIEGDQTSLGGTFELKTNEALNGDLTVMGGSAVLRSDSVVAGDLTIMGGSVIVEDNARITGDIAMFGGSMTNSGDVDGDITQFGGSVNIKESAQISGSFERVGGSRSIAPGASVGRSGVDIGQPEQPEQPAESAAEVAPAQPAEPTADARNPIQRALRNLRNTANLDEDDVNINIARDGKVFPGAIIITLLTLLCAVLIPRNVAQAVLLARSQALMTGGVGFLSLIAGAIVLGVASILIITIPITASIAFIAVVVGWTVTAQLAGEQVMRFFNRGNWQPLSVIIAGSLVMALLGAIPIIGDLLGVAFVSIGLGAFVLTRGGTRSYPVTSVGFPRQG
jgi:hypothetical protein